MVLWGIPYPGASPEPNSRRHLLILVRRGYDQATILIFQMRASDLKEMR